MTFPADRSPRRRIGRSTRSRGARRFAIGSSLGPAWQTPQSRRATLYTLTDRGNIPGDHREHAGQSCNPLHPVTTSLPRRVDLLTHRRQAVGPSGFPCV